MIELVAVVALLAVDLWLAWDRPWLQVLTRGLVAAVLVASFLRRRTGRSAAPPDGRRKKGQHKMPPGRAWLEAAAVTLVLGLTVLAWAAAVSGPLDELDLSLLAAPASVLGLWLLRHLALAAVQQLALQLFLWPVAKEALASGLLATVATAVLFGLGHLPSAPLAIATTIAAALWLGLYRRSQRLAPLIISHLLLAAVASTLPARLFLKMKVGTPALEIAAEQRSLASEEKQALLHAIATPRYSSDQGKTDSEYVAGLYRDILGRAAADNEVRHGVEQLAQGPGAGQTQLSRLGLAKRMLVAEELDEATLWRRVIDDQPLAPGIEITPTSDDARFAGWYDAEDAWRWAREAEPAIGFRLDREPDRVYVLALSAGSAAHVAPDARQRSITVELELNGVLVGCSRFTDFTPRDDRFLVEPEYLAADGDNELRFLVATEGRKRGNAGAVVVAGESRALGLGLRRLRVAPLRFPAAAILFTDDDYFLEGFSIAEERLRWTREPTARLTYPLRQIVPDGCYTLQLEAGAFERQEVGLSVNGQKVAEWTLDGLEPQLRSIRIDAELLRSGPNAVGFDLPGARSPEGDPRRLGLALISLRIYPMKDCS